MNKTELRKIMVAVLPACMFAVAALLGSLLVALLFIKPEGRAALMTAAVLASVPGSIALFWGYPHSTSRLTLNNALLRGAGAVAVTHLLYGLFLFPVLWFLNREGFYTAARDIRSVIFMGIFSVFFFGWLTIPFGLAAGYYLAKLAYTFFPPPPASASDQPDAG